MRTFGNPQTLNLYSYVANNPTTGVDPEGHFRLDFNTPMFQNGDDCMYCGTGATDKQQVQQQQQNKQAQQETAQGLAVQVPQAVKSAIMNSVMPATPQSVQTRPAGSMKRAE